MTLLPIVSRELLVAARRRVTYWGRLVTAGTAIGLGTILVWSWQTDAIPQLEQGHWLFWMLTASAGFFALLGGAMSTADSLSVEKRNGTLGLLFLTDLKGYDVVLGKLVASSLRCAYGLLAVLPVMAIPLMMGGISAGEEFRMALLVLNALFFSLALGMAVSSICRSAVGAVWITFAIIFILNAGAPALGAWLGHITRSKRFIWFFLPSSGFSYSAAWDVRYKVSPSHFWNSVSLIHGLGWVSLIFASLIAPRTWQDRPPSVARLRWRQKWRLWSCGNTRQRDSFRSRLLNQNAYFWLASRSRLKPVLVWALLGVLAFVWFWGQAKFKEDWINPGTFAVTAVLLNTVLKTWIGNEAGRQLAEDRAQGTLELLLSTSLGVPEILKGQARALARQFLGPLLVALALELIFMYCVPFRWCRVDFRDDQDDILMWLCLLGAGLIILAADVVTLFWVAQWQALVAKNPLRAIAHTKILVFFAPLLCWIGSMYMLGIAGAIKGWSTILGLWFGIGLLADFFLILYAGERLRCDFRALASQRYAAPKSPGK